MEEACLHRFGTLRPQGEVPVVRSDLDLVFQSGASRKQLFETTMPRVHPPPHTPEQNGMIERFFRSLKEECVWQHNFRERRGQTGHQLLDRTLQRGTAPSEPGLPEPQAVPRARQQVQMVA